MFTNGRTTSGRGLPISPNQGAVRPLSLEETRITGGFWKKRQDLNATAIIGHAEKWMERLGWIGNFDAATAGRLPKNRTGREFSDSDVYKLMEAMAWEIGRTGNAALESRFQALVARIAPVQEEDGYLNTNFGRPGQAPKYSDLEEGHELYCYGHLIQSAIARGRTHGRDRFVEIAIKAADHVCAMFGPDGIDSIGGHPEIEPALVELARYTGERKYLDQAQLFIERRGHGRLADIWFGPQYFQDDVPVRDAHALRGHAVRALYLAAGALDVAVETGDAELKRAVAAQTARTVSRRTYLTGGMGAHHEGEAFGQDFELPPDRAYAETCAGVAAVMLGERLLLATGTVEHADLVERVLYNIVATSPSENGQAFFYTNPLHQREPGTEAAGDELAPRAASSLRAPWFAVSCCPPNVARLLASLGTYIATADDEGVQLQQFVDSEVRTALPDGCPASFRVETNYPHDGEIRVTVTEDATHPWTLRIRVPAWATEGAVLHAFGNETTVGPGYAQVSKEFSVGDTIVLELPVRARWTWADPRVDAVRGQVAVERGPLVMALESTDLGESVNTASVLTSEEPVERDGQVLVPVRTATTPEASWPFSYRAGSRADTHDIGLVPLVPYHLWGNRGPSTMRVWIPVAAD